MTWVALRRVTLASLWEALSWKAELPSDHSWLGTDRSLAVRLWLAEPWVSLAGGVLMACMMTAGRSASWLSHASWWQILGTTALEAVICGGVVRAVVVTAKELRRPGA